MAKIKPCPKNRVRDASTGAKIRKSRLADRSRARKRQPTLKDATVKEGRIAKAENAERGSEKVADEEEPATAEEESSVAEDTGVPEEQVETLADDLPPEGAKKHIHPCICDLTARQRAKVEAHLAHHRRMAHKFAVRIKQIEAELARIEEERLERQRELEEQEELFGDEYEMVGKKKKRKKRSARRASMVSLGVKQVINWRKAPRIQTKDTKASKLRKQFTAYCGKLPQPASPRVEIDFRNEPTIPIRETATSHLRTKVNIKKKDYLIKHEDKRPLFQTPYYV